MSSRDLYSAGARLLGLYLAINGLVALLGLAGTYEAAFNSKAAHPLGYALIAAVQALLLIAIGAVLFLRNRPSTVVSATASLTRGDLLFVGLQLLGVYFAVAGLIGILHAVSDIMAVEASYTLHFTDTALALAYACIGLFLVFRPSKVVNVIAA